jgi:hypothetical protein
MQVRSAAPIHVQEMGYKEKPYRRAAARSKNQNITPLLLGAGIVAIAALIAAMAKNNGPQPK